MDSFRDHPEEAITPTLPTTDVSASSHHESRTPVPSDWEHAKILIGRSFRKDWQKPKLYVAKFLLLPLLLMLYCIGFLFGADGLSEEPAMIVGGFELFDGTSWKYPQVIHLAVFDERAASLGGEKMQEQFVLVGVEKDVDLDWSSSVTTTNRTEFLEDCQATILLDSTSSDEVCVYLDAMDDYTIFYGGRKMYLPINSPWRGLNGQ